MIAPWTTTVSNAISTDQFKIFKNTQYIPSVSSNLLTTITGTTVSTIIKCAKQCMENIWCQTAAYYMQSQQCLLYREKYGLGQLIDDNTQSMSVITVLSRNPSAKYCAFPGSNLNFMRNQFIYSANQLVAFGAQNAVLGSFVASANGSIGSMIWQMYGSFSSVGRFSAQDDGNLVVYSGMGCTSNTNSGGVSNSPYCLSVLNNGTLVWVNKFNVRVCPTSSKPLCTCL